MQTQIEQKNSEWVLPPQILLETIAPRGERREEGMKLMVCGDANCGIYIAKIQ